MKVKIFSCYSSEGAVEDKVNEFIEDIGTDKVVDIKLSESKNDWTVMVIYREE